MKKRNSYILLISIIVVGVVIDLITKIIFANILLNGEIVLIPSLLKFTYVENTGAAYGMFGGRTWILILISIVFIIGFLLYDIFNHSNNGWYICGVGLILSGAFGNLVDRIFLGYVRDFINIKYFNFVFNFADMFITFGIICFAIYLIISMVKDAKEKKGKSKDNAVDGK
ncbi:MAG: signal peptidase II [Christensenellales bacterium]